MDKNSMEKIERDFNVNEQMTLIYDSSRQSHMPRYSEYILHNKKRTKLTTFYCPLVLAKT
eukprot:4559204-Amphidinium_carterae.2